jgi:hypothetical protein
MLSCKFGTQLDKKDSDQFLKRTSVTVTLALQSTTLQNEPPLKI